MPDIVDPKTRSRMMSGIKWKDTKPELLIRHALHGEGLRYRLHVKGLPGCPDIVFPRFHSVVFVHGCFWHGHDCPLFRLPDTRAEFWETKIAYNRKRDAEVAALLLKKNWRYLIVWECAIKGRGKLPLDSLTRTISGWIRGSQSNSLEIRGW